MLIQMKIWARCMYQFRNGIRENFPFFFLYSPSTWTKTFLISFLRPSRKNSISLLDNHIDGCVNGKQWKYELYSRLILLKPLEQRTKGRKKHIFDVKMRNVCFPPQLWDWEINEISIFFRFCRNIVTGAMRQITRVRQSFAIESESKICARVSKGERKTQKRTTKLKLNFMKLWYTKCAQECL